jgi:hypothetical protein
LEIHVHGKGVEEDKGQQESKLRVNRYGICDVSAWIQAGWDEAVSQVLAIDASELNAALAACVFIETR